MTGGEEALSPRLRGLPGDPCIDRAVDAPPLNDSPAHRRVGRNNFNDRVFPFLLRHCEGRWGRRLLACRLGTPGSDSLRHVRPEGGLFFCFLGRLRRRLLRELIALARGAPTRFVGLTPPRGRWSGKHGQLRVGQRGRRALRGHVRRRNVRLGRSDSLVRYDRKFLSLLRRRRHKYPHGDRGCRGRERHDPSQVPPRCRARRPRADRRFRSHERSQQRLTTGTVGKMPLNRGRRGRRQRTLDPSSERFAVDALVRNRRRTACLPEQVIQRPISRVPCAHNSVPRAPCLVPCALRPAPRALRPAPCALRPAPCALCPTPCALRPTPYALSLLERSGAIFLPADSVPSTSVRSSGPASLTTASKQSVS